MKQKKKSNINQEEEKNSRNLQIRRLEFKLKITNLQILTSISPSIRFTQHKFKLIQLKTLDTHHWDKNTKKINLQAWILTTSIQKRKAKRNSNIQ